ncbi:glycosyltransferase family 2 protein [Clostridium thermobutyricum]|uniref:glycosyltransferase family 2 protein n=1 Tax=Clostridium thermobutyricum TaxID=29372 RepID=UPI0018AC215A|nr:glycosyltransferase family 2 protein [Clostridium thermobutyricum]
MTTIGEIYLISSIVIIFIAYLLYLKFKSVRFIIILLGLISSLVYIVWRFTVIPTFGLSLVMGILLVIAELIGIIQFFDFEYFSTRKYKLEKKELIDPTSKNLPSIDILICTYNEPVDLLKKTIIGAIKLNYNKEKLNVYVCDDGRRDEVKKLCEEYLVNYITRDTNEGAKAGNINNALKYINSEFVSILDADMIAKHNFLKKTMQYFLDDDNLAFVQVPQSYYNADMYQYNMITNIPNEQDMFMRDIQEARASLNAVLHVGTNAIFRRKHLDSVGGFPTFSITEDMALGMKLQSKGYNSILVNEPLVLGLSATTLEETIKQRKRWARGNLQVFKRNNPLFMKGLKLSQKIAYIDGLIYWFSSLQKIIYIIAPIAYLLFGILSIRASLWELLPYYIPFLVSQMVVFKVLSPGTRNLKWSHFYETVMAPSISASILSELFSLKSVGFKVTSKDITNEKAYFQFRVILPHIILLIGTVVSWFICGYLIKAGKVLPSYVILNIIWSIYNAVGIIVAIKVAYQKPMFRSSERIEIRDNFITKLYVNEKEYNIKVHDISDTGLGLKMIDYININSNDKIKIKINDLYIKCKLARKNKTFIGIQFEELNKEETIEIINLYIENLKPFYDLKRDSNNFI